MGKCGEMLPYLFKMIELEGDRGYSVGLLFPEFHVFFPYTTKLPRCSQRWEEIGDEF